MKKLRILVLVLGLILIITCAVNAQMPVNARAIGLGGAYTAVADDVFGCYWNPAGVNNLGSIKVGVINPHASVRGEKQFTNLINNFPSGTTAQIDLIKDFGNENTSASIANQITVGAHGWAISVVGFANGLISPNGGEGFDWVSTPGGGRVPAEGSFGDISGNYSYMLMGTMARRVAEKTDVGVNLKYINGRFGNTHIEFTNDLGGATVFENWGNDKSGVGLDVGAINRITPDLNVGATIFNVIQPKGFKDSYKRTLNIGAAYQPKILGNKLLAAVDLQDIFDGQPKLRVGAEFKISKGLALRTGIFKRSFTIGLGIGKLGIVYSPNKSLSGFSLTF